MNEANEFRLEVVGVKKFQKHEMPSVDEVQEKLKRLWEICWKREEDLAWDYKRVFWKPLGKFQFREPEDWEPAFRVETSSAAEKTEWGVWRCSERIAAATVL